MFQALSRYRSVSRGGSKKEGRGGNEGWMVWAEMKRVSYHLV